MAGTLQLAEGTAPATPASGYHDLYPDASGNWHILDDAGTDKTLATTADVFATANLADEAVTNVKLAHMAQGTLKGRGAADGTGDATDLSAAQAAAILAGQFAEVGDADWTTISPLGTYWSTSSLTPTGITFAVPQYRKVAGVVHLRGAAKVTNSTTGALGTLPDGYRPSNTFFTPAAVTTATVESTTAVKITADGAISFDATTNTTYHLDGISFIPVPAA